LKKNKRPLICQKGENVMKMNNQQRIFNLLMILVMTLLIVAGISSFAISKDKDKDNYSQVTVMTRNLYLGADIFKVVDAAQQIDTLPMVVAEVYNTMLFTNFWARAEAIADEIAELMNQTLSVFRKYPLSLNRHPVIFLMEIR
jgi:hypothetical protein